MAIINQRTGYFGYTLDGTVGATPIDSHGRVNRAIFAITYPIQPNDVEFTISKGPEDWAAQMGDGSIIPLSNPTILYANRDNSIIQFDMDEVYPSNSPCVLVYRSDTAVVNVKQRDEARPFEMNSVSGHFAFTVEGYGGSELENGNVDRLIATIPFPQQSAHVTFTISKGPNDWGARMGDGSIIELYDPEILYTNQENAVVQFSMRTPYPSNSPCVLVYRSQGATFNIVTDSEENEFVPVQDIINVPDTILLGSVINLTSAEMVPMNASHQGTIWTVESGRAAINNNKLTAAMAGRISIKAEVVNGKQKDENFVKLFNIEAVSNVVDVLADPQPEVEATFGMITERIYIKGHSNNEILNFQWYHNIVNNYNGAVPIDNATDTVYYLPADLSVGDHYYFCEVSSPGAVSVKSRISHVNVELPLTNVAIYPTTNTLEQGSERQLHYNHIPATRTAPEVVWSSSDSNIITVDATGKITAKAAGTVIITAKEVYGDIEGKLQITVPVYVSVADITGIPTSIVDETPVVLQPTVLPDNAARKDIIWSIVVTGESTECLSDVNRGTLTAYDIGDNDHSKYLKLRAVIEHGLSPVEDFVREFTIEVTHRYIGVDSISVSRRDPDANNPLIRTFSGNIRRAVSPVPMSTSRIATYATGAVVSAYVDEKNILEAEVSPKNSTARFVRFEMKDPGTTGAKIIDGNELVATAAGQCIVTAKIINGSTMSTDYNEDITVQVYAARVPVTSAKFTIDEWDPHPVNGHATKLNVHVLPENATEKNAVIKLKDAGEANVFWNEDTDEISCVASNMTYEMTNATALFEIRILNGIAKNIDYVTQVRIRIKGPNPPDIITPVEDLELNLPTPLRALYPIIMQEHEIMPWNASQKEAEFSQERDGEDAGANSIMYNPNEYDLQNQCMSDFFDWEKDATYLFPWHKGRVKIHVRLPNADTRDHQDIYCQDTLDWEKDFYINFDDPYIPVKEVLNVPIKIPRGREVQLCGELYTDGGLKFYNAMWDEEKPSYTDLQWRIGSRYIDSREYPNTAGGVIRDNNILYASTTGKFTIQAYVENGSKEPIQWYDDEHEQVGEPFTQLFTIEVVDDAEEAFTDPIVTLTLRDWREIKVYTYENLTKLCSDLPADTEITINNVKFRKSDVVEVKFWDPNPQSSKEPAPLNDQPGELPEEEEDEEEEEEEIRLPNVTSLRNFGRNFTSLTKIDRIPETVTGDNCLRNFLQGCTSFNQDIEIPNGVTGNACLQYFLRDCTSFNSNVTFGYNKESTEDQIAIIGGDCMHGFMAGCTAFNKPIQIPDCITGPGCLERFLMDCTSFNQEITIPENLVGPWSLREFLSGCVKFNHPLTLPIDIGKYAYELNNMMRNCDAMCSDITVPLGTGQNANVSEQTFSCVHKNAPMISRGIKLKGPGAQALLDKMLNNLDDPMYRNVSLGE